MPTTLLATGVVQPVYEAEYPTDYEPAYLAEVPRERIAAPMCRAAASEVMSAPIPGLEAYPTRPRSRMRATPAGAGALLPQSDRRRPRRGRPTLRPSA